LRKREKRRGEKVQESATSCRLTAKASTRKDSIVRRKGNNDSRVPQAAAAVHECAHDFLVTPPAVCPQGMDKMAGETERKKRRQPHVVTASTATTHAQTFENAHTQCATHASTLSFHSSRVDLGTLRGQARKEKPRKKKDVCPCTSLRKLLRLRYIRRWRVP